MTAVPKPSHIAMMAGGLITLLFSFFRFFDVPGGGDPSAWSTKFDLFPLATWPALFGLIVGGTAAAVAFGNVRLPETVATFTWDQIDVVLSFAALVVMIGFLFAGDKGFGYWFMFLGVIAYSTGSVMELLGVGAAGSGRTRGAQGGGPSTPF